MCYALSTTPAHAACNFHSNITTNTKDLTNWTTPCTIAGGTIEGIDKTTTDTDTANTATLTLATGASITINASGTLVTGSLNLTGGNIAIQDTGVIKIGTPLYVADADADGWPSDFTLYDATASGKRRLALMRDFSTIDCNDINDPRLDNICCTVSTYYADNDGDGYGAGAGISMCPASGYVTNNSDCYDSNANVHPGSTTCSTSHRGDGSFDYNCSSTQTTCGTLYYSTSYVTKNGCSGGKCVKTGEATCQGGAVGCGSVGRVSGGRVSTKSCKNCGGNNGACTGLGGSGTQACQ